MYNVYKVYIIIRDVRYSLGTLHDVWMRVYVYTYVRVPIRYEGVLISSIKCEFSLRLTLTTTRASV